MGVYCNSDTFVKKCFKCKTVKDDSEFYKDKSRSDGLMYQCKDCKKGYTLDNHDAYKAYLKNYYAENKESCQKAVKAHYVANKEKYNAMAKTRYEANKEDHQARSRAWYVANKEAQQAFMREYYRTHRDQYLQYNQNRRARLAEAFVEHIDRQVVWGRDNMHCCMCVKFVPFEEMHLDHVIPIFDGGLHAYNNVQTLCGSCNSSKGTKLVVTSARPWKIEGVTVAA